MYTPPAYAETDERLLSERMHAWSFATLVTHGCEGLNATHLPFLVDDEAAHGLLTTHLSRGNAQYRGLKAGASALVIFQGPFSEAAARGADYRAPCLFSRQESSKGLRLIHFPRLVPGLFPRFSLGCQQISSDVPAR